MVNSTSCRSQKNQLSTLPTAFIGAATTFTTAFTAFFATNPTAFTGAVTTSTTASNIISGTFSTIPRASSKKVTPSIDYYSMSYAKFSNYRASELFGFLW